MIRRRTARSTKPSARARSNGAKKRGSIQEAVAALARLEPASPKAKRIIALLRSWLTDESGYDEQTWPILKKALNRERVRVGARKLFDD